MKPSGLTLIVPVYNERAGIEATIEALKAVKKAAGFDMEIIVVNDGSNDGTEEVLEKIAKRDFTVINRSENHGYGAALKKGISRASHPYIAITDADGTYPNELFPDLFEQMVAEDLDMLVGSRTGLKVNIPLIRRPAKWILRMIANYLCNRKIPDLNSGFRIMRKDVLMKYMKLLPDGFSFTTTITLSMLTNGHRIRYRAIDYHSRDGKSKIRPIYDTLNFFQLIVRTVIYFDPLRVFIPASFSCLAVSVLMVLYRLFAGYGFGVTSVVFFVLGIQLLAIGMIADLIDKRLP